LPEEVRGLRERQKEQRQQQILAAAGKLFTEVGYDETTMEQIAEEAILSVPTVYSYFPSKSDLLFALFEIDDSLIEPVIENLLAKLPKDPRDAIAAVELAVIREGYDISKKRVWREISAAALRAPDARRVDFVALQNSRVEWIARAFQVLKDRGQVREGLDCDAAARTVYSIGRNSFRMYITNDGMDIKELELQIRTSVALLFEGVGVPAVQADLKSKASKRGLRS
jgi:AcrR family transcriptional regulator